MTRAWWTVATGMACSAYVHVRRLRASREEAIGRLHLATLAAAGAPTIVEAAAVSLGRRMGASFRERELAQDAIDLEREAARAQTRRLAS